MSNVMERCIKGTGCWDEIIPGTMKLVVYIQLMMQCISEVLLRAAFEWAFILSDYI